MQALENAPAAFQVLDCQLILQPSQQKVRSRKVLEDEDDLARRVQRIDEPGSFRPQAAGGQFPVKRQLAPQQGTAIAAVRLDHAPVVSHLQDHLLKSLAGEIQADEDSAFPLLLNRLVDRVAQEERLNLGINLGRRGVGLQQVFDPGGNRGLRIGASVLDLVSAQLKTPARIRTVTVIQRQIVAEGDPTTS